MSQKKVSHKLADAVRRELGEDMDKEHQRADWGGELTPEMLEYASKDSEVLLRLSDALAVKVEKGSLERVAEIEHRTLPAVLWMSGAGVPFDAAGWEARVARLDDDLVIRTDELDRLAPGHPEGGEWNWNSPQQIVRVFDLAGAKLPNTKEETLRRIDHPLAKALLARRGISKLLGTYGAPLLDKVEGGRIYPSWHQIGAGTGRMSCSNPNLQNLPEEVRRYVMASEGRMFVKADYSQVELRIAAKISGDKKMLEAYQRGEDLHAITAKSLTGREDVRKEERRLAKAVNFGLLYGQGPEGLMNYARASYGVEMTIWEAARYRDRFFETYPGIAAWHEREGMKSWRESTETRTLSGRRRTGVRAFTQRVNSPVQGTGGDGLKLALALLYERRGRCPGAVPILAVHDEIVVECDEGQTAEIVTWLEEAMGDGMDEILNGNDTKGPRIPIVVDVESAKSWAG